MVCKMFCSYVVFNSFLFVKNCVYVYNKVLSFFGKIYNFVSSNNWNSLIVDCCNDLCCVML